MYAILRFMDYIKPILVQNVIKKVQIYGKDIAILQIKKLGGHYDT